MIPRIETAAAKEKSPAAEQHPLEPFLPEGARLLMLGSFPPARRRWSMEFYYPNFQNDMWRIFGLCFFGDREHFIAPGAEAPASAKRFEEAAIRRFLTERGIALSDTARSVVRGQGDASDQHLKVVESIALGALLDSLPQCAAVAVTGAKALETILPLTGASEVPGIGGFSVFDYQGRRLRLYRMPSSSRAYPLKLEQKAEIYARMFGELGFAVGFTE